MGHGRKKSSHTSSSQHRSSANSSAGGGSGHNRASSDRGEQEVVTAAAENFGSGLEQHHHDDDDDVDDVLVQALIMAASSPPEFSGGGGGAYIYSPPGYDNNYYSMENNMQSPGVGKITAGLLLCAGLSVILSICTGVSISIPYLEGKATTTTTTGGAAASSSPQVLDRQVVSSLNQRTTIWDPSIASLQTITGSDGEQQQQQQDQSILPVVEESLLSNSPPRTGASTASGPSGNPSSTRKPPISSPVSSAPVDHSIYLRMEPPRFTYEGMSRVKPKPCPPRPGSKRQSWWSSSSSSSSSSDQYYEAYGQKKNETEQPIMGFTTWQELQIAFQDANAYSADRFMRWNEFFAATEDAFAGGKAFPRGIDPSLYYEEDIVLRICPGTVVKASNYYYYNYYNYLFAGGITKRRRSPTPIFVNAENIVLECDDCTFQVNGGSHFSFGPHAKNVLFRGITFRGAKTTSLLFFHDGAEVSLEDCLFADNFATDKQIGTVADVNSTSVVNFYRCLMENGPNDKPAGLTSLSIRTKDGDVS